MALILLAFVSYTPFDLRISALYARPPADVRLRGPPVDAIKARQRAFERRRANQSVSYPVGEFWIDTARTVC